MQLPRQEGLGKWDGPRGPTATSENYKHLAPVFLFLFLFLSRCPFMGIVVCGHDVIMLVAVAVAVAMAVTVVEQKAPP